MQASTSIPDGIVVAAAATPTRTGPPLRPRSMKMLVVAAALPRSAGGSGPMTAANTAGVTNAVPSPSRTEPANSPPGGRPAPTAASPAADDVSAPAATRRGGNRSGNPANAVRQSTTVHP